jgi:hypothetical protein
MTSNPRTSQAGQLRTTSRYAVGEVPARWAYASFQVLSRRNISASSSVRVLIMDSYVVQTASAKWPSTDKDIVVIFRLGVEWEQRNPGLRDPPLLLAGNGVALPFLRSCICVTLRQRVGRFLIGEHAICCRPAPDI